MNQNLSGILLLFQCMEALQSSPLPESAEILDILNRIEFEGLFFSHDKLAERQVGRTNYWSLPMKRVNPSCPIPPTNSIVD